MARLERVRLSGRYDSDGVAGAIAVAYHQQAQCSPQPKDKEAILAARVDWVIDQQGVTIKKHRAGLIKRHAMLALVCLVLRWVPLERQVLHAHSVHTPCRGVKAFQAEAAKENHTLFSGNAWRQRSSLQCAKDTRTVYAGLQMLCFKVKLLS